VEAVTCKKELLIEIPADVVRQEAETVAAQYVKVVRIPGFRPGRAPTSLVRRRYREDIRSEVVQALVPRFFENAVKDHKLSIVGQPRFDDLQFEEDRPITVKATFEVLPDFVLREYKGLEVEEEEPVVTDADIEKAIENLRQNAATFEVVTDRPAAVDDYVLVNYQGRDSKAPGAAPVQAHDALVHLGGEGTVAAFTENLQGAKAGEVREFPVVYPEDFGQKSLAGKAFSYRVEVLSIKRKVVPPADDDLAKSVSEFSTLDELRAKVRQDLTERTKRRVEAEAKQKLVEMLIRAHEFPVPEVMVENQLDRKLERMIGQLVAQGIDPRQTQVDWHKIREGGRPDAEKEVRAALILGKVAEAEKIEVSEEELDETVREMAQEGRETPAVLKTRLTREGSLDRIRINRRQQKALECVYRNAKITRKSV
jgi:trigger factor